MIADRAGWWSLRQYSTVRADLVNNATTGDPTFNALPTGVDTQVAVWDAQLSFSICLPSN
jgi:hypothetical protein